MTTRSLASLVMTAVAVTVTSTLGAQLRPAPLRVDIPLVDAPFNIANGLRGPSMAQSVAVGETFYEVAHTSIQKAWGKHTKLANLSLVVFDIFGGLLPGGQAWVHEEFHRSVMGNRDVGSFNDIYRFDLAASVVAVSHVEDADLIRLKATYPIEQVRMGAAGIEGENMLVDRLQKNRFFYGSKANNVALYWLTKINSYDYVSSGTSSFADSLTDEMNVIDGANVAKRDFTGHDFTAWAYDLFRPTEAYAARGVHPSGVGIDRYVAPRDLTTDERAFLAREGRLQLLNFADLNLLGIDGFTVNGMKLNATASHYLTSFGHTIDLNLFAKKGDMNLFVVGRRYSNGARSFPGIDAQMLNAPVTIAGRGFEISPRLAMWMQPEDQAFRTTSAQAGALGSIKIRPASSSLVTTFVELEAKTAGWVAGNVNLGSNVSVRMGGSLRLK